MGPEVWATWQCCPSSGGGGALSLVPGLSLPGSGARLAPSGGPVWVPVGNHLLQAPPRQTPPQGSPPEGPGRAGGSPSSLTPTQPAWPPAPPPGRPSVPALPVSGSASEPGWGPEGKGRSSSIQTCSAGVRRGRGEAEPTRTAEGESRPGPAPRLVHRQAFRVAWVEAPGRQGRASSFAVPGGDGKEPRGWPWREGSPRAARAAPPGPLPTGPGPSRIAPFTSVKWKVAPPHPRKPSLQGLQDQAGGRSGLGGCRQRVLKGRVGWRRFWALSRLTPCWPDQ